MRIPLGRAHMLASSVIREARRAGIGADAITPVGSLRRYAPDVGDVSLLAVVAAATQKHVLRSFARLPIVTDINTERPCSVSVVTARGPVTLHVSAPHDAGASLVWHTGSRSHVEQLQARARRFG